ncbi:MAG: cell division protein ZipA C-terminal FtsZ-binding domain-containing protein [Gammaproteobacteria bacterium]|nr:cell division protein ZipA C-terminal FtsZ-binding domain-containing protein [Gammaproteobacteria bacterium]
MEDYLRLGLLLIAGIIVFFILLETWNSRRRLKLARLESKYMSPSISADEVLGLDPREPRIVNPEQLSLDGECLALKNVSVAKADEPLKTPARLEESAELITKDAKTKDDLAKDLLIINVFAKPNHQFFSYDLLQAISATGMQFGEMSIFHHYQLTSEGRVSLFSLASATEPGYFDIDRMGDFACAGLTLFTNLKDVPDAKATFELMLKTAEQLADDLDGELRANPRTPWNDTVLNQYQQKVARYQTMKEV